MHYRMGLLLLAIQATLLWPANLVGEPKGGESLPDSQAKSDESRLSVVEARQQAKLLHSTYQATLLTVHRYYFMDGGRTPIPSRVMEEVFHWMDQETRGKTRWISVNTEAMSLDHQPESEVEKQAAQALASGQDEFELIRDGVYHRAGAIPLANSCLKCHEPSLLQQRTKKRVAGLVISLPIK